MGYRAVSPSIKPFFKIESNEKGPYSNWSERHIAFAAGHGTFSLNDGFITEKGIAHRCGSVVTDLELPASLRTAEEAYANCLYYYDGSCRACMERCPAGAVTERGHDKKICSAYLDSLGYNPRQGYEDSSSVWGCGFCQTKVPCEHGIPAKILKSRAG
jgi:epoxyqueuosine reductase QueG